MKKTGTLAALAKAKAEAARPVTQADLDKSTAELFKALDQAHESRRPGLQAIADRIAAQNPTWPPERILAEAKNQWQQAQGETR